MATASISQAKDYFIVGPSLQRNNGVMEAIYGLLYLPPNYKLILPSAMPADTAFQDEVEAAVKKNALNKRVHFINNAVAPSSPEALASAVLDVARAV